MLVYMDTGALIALNDRSDGSPSRSWSGSGYGPRSPLTRISMFTGSPESLAKSRGPLESDGNIPAPRGMDVMHPGRRIGDRGRIA